MITKKIKYQTFINAIPDMKIGNIYIRYASHKNSGYPFNQPERDRHNQSVEFLIEDINNKYRNHTGMVEVDLITEEEKNHQLEEHLKWKKEKLKEKEEQLEYSMMFNPDIMYEQEIGDNVFTNKYTFLIDTKNKLERMDVNGFSHGLEKINDDRIKHHKKIWDKVKK